MPNLYLASTSPWRRRLLTDAGIAVLTESPGVDERSVEIADPVLLARDLARRKALAVAARHPDAWVLGADQVGYDLDPPGPPFGKPTDPEDHFRRLRSMVGRRHALVTAFSLVGPGIDVHEHETSVLTARNDLEDDELRAYVASGEGSGCAGGYAIEGRGVFLFEKIDGDWFNVVGLPLLRVVSALRAHGWRAR
jgi:septum formation protein